jgi:hypothetical protein
MSVDADRVIRMPKTAWRVDGPSLWLPDKIVE